jgi:hypothetical protein
VGEVLERPGQRVVVVHLRLRAVDLRIRDRVAPARAGPALPAHHLAQQMGEEEGDLRWQDFYRVVHKGHLSAPLLVGALGCKGMGISNAPRHPARPANARLTLGWAADADLDGLDEGDYTVVLSRFGRPLTVRLSLVGLRHQGCPWVRRDRHYMRLSVTPAATGGAA